MTASRRNAFTLVELLVVTGLMVSLWGLILVGIRPSDASSIRRAAQDFAGMLLAAQSRALGKPQGAGVMVASNGGNARAGTDAYDTATQPLCVAGITGPWPPPELTGTTRPTSVVISGSGVDTSMLQSTFKLRFQTAGGDIVSPWFGFTAAAGSTSGTASFRSSAGQTVRNTIWPTGTGSLQGAFAQYPSLGTMKLAMPKQVAVDLRHSGVGENPSAAHGYGSFEGQATIAVAYDEIGRLSDVMRKVLETRSSADQPIVAGETVYFLFASLSDIQQSRSLSNRNSVWVAINPLSGRVTVAENVPQATEDATALKAARAKAREGSALR